MCKKTIAIAMVLTLAWIAMALSACGGRKEAPAATEAPAEKTMEALVEEVSEAPTEEAAE